ncbi:MAG: murein biosynthesis integral membrane protein MurJ [Acidobacteriota bacterium]
MTSETTPVAAPPATKVKKRATGFAALVAAGILLSRVAGLVREKVFAHYFGNSVAAGAFKAALKIPNLLQNLFGEGVLSASFIPVYSRLLARGEEELAGRVAGAIASLLAVLVSVLVLIGVLATPVLIDFIAPGFSGPGRELTINLVRILFPATGILVMSAWCLGVLNSHHRFFLSYVAPVIWNATMIGTMVFFGVRAGQFPLAIALAWGTVAGAVLQLGVQLPFVFRYARSVKFRFDTALEPVRLVVRNSVPVFIGRGAVQLSAYIDTLIASLLGFAAVSAISFAQTIYLLPISLFGMSIAAAELPQMSGTVGSESEVNEALRKRLSRALRQITFFVIPSAIAFLFIGDQLVAGLYQGGEFRSADTRLVWYILIGSTVGLLAASQARSFNSAFYALHDTKTPLRFALVRITLTGVLGYLLAFPLRPLIILFFTGVIHFPLPGRADAAVLMGAVGLTASAGMAGWVEFFLLRKAMERRIGPARVDRSYQLRLWIAAILAGLGARGFGLVVVPLIVAQSWLLGRIFAAMLIAGIFGVIYFATAFLAGVPEAKSTLGRLVRRR